MRIIFLITLFYYCDKLEIDKTPSSLLNDRYNKISTGLTILKLSNANF